MREFEYKFLINESQYKSIINRLQGKFNHKCKENTQINYYYDDDENSLDKQDITLRIRQKSHSLAMEVKIPVIKDEYLKVKDEYAVPIEEMPISFHLAKYYVNKYLKDIDIVRLKGVLVTERKVYKIREEIEINIDKNWYLGVTDYELEIEFNPKLQSYILPLISEIIQPNHMNLSGGKRYRFFRRLNDINCIEL